MIIFHFVSICAEWMRMRADVCFTIGKQCYAPHYKSGDGFGPYGCTNVTKTSRWPPTPECNSQDVYGVRISRYGKAITVRRMDSLSLGTWTLYAEIKSIFIVGPLPSLSLRLRTKIFPRRCYYLQKRMQIKPEHANTKHKKKMWNTGERRATVRWVLGQPSTLPHHPLIWTWTWTVL